MRYYFVTYRHQIPETDVDYTDNMTTDKHPIDWLKESPAKASGGFTQSTTILFYKPITRKEYRKLQQEGC